MTGTIVRAGSGRRLRRAAPAVPYAAVAVGLYALSSAWAAILLYHGGMVVVLGLSRGWAVPRMASSSRSRLILGVMVAGSALVGPFLYVIWSTVRTSGLDLGAELADLGLAGWPRGLFVVYYFTVNPLLEEMFWRGYLGSESTRPVWNDGFFAGYHVLVLVLLVQPVWVAGGFVGLAFAAWLWRQTARESGGLLVPVVSHAVADASLILAALRLAS